jgi:hypothetical protein
MNNSLSSWFGVPRHWRGKPNQEKRDCAWVRESPSRTPPLAAKAARQLIIYVLTYQGEVAILTLMLGLGKLNNKT